MANDENLQKNVNSFNFTPELVKDINPGSTGSFPSELTVFDGKLFFQARDGINGSELWVSDGTENGTQLVKDINTRENSPPSGSSFPSGFTVFDGKLFFGANDDTNGRELWVSDGTENGTQLVKDINPTTTGFSPRDQLFPANLTVFDGKLFFVADDGANNATNGGELWVSDGTEDGTRQLKDINPGSADSFPDNLRIFNNLLFFSARNEANGEELWVSDGTESGTQLLKDINPNNDNFLPNNSSSPSGFTAFDGKLFFSADDGTNGREVWVTDGTENGTQLFKDINLGSESSDSNNFIALGGKLFFTANDGTNGRELWVTDGTVDGTQLFKDINPGNESSNPRNFAASDEKLFFTADDGTNGRELWVTDGTVDGTQLLRDINSNGDTFFSRGSIIFDNKLFFTANDGTTGRELWVSDGTSDGTQLVADINPGEGSSEPGDFTVFDGKLFFSANDGTNGRELWKLDLNSSNPVNQIKGTRNDDDIKGTSGNDQISGNNGNDTIKGRQGNDTIEGGRGGDIIRGNAGDDVLAADRIDRFDDFDGENSELRGDNGNDTIYGGSKDELIGGGNGNDVLFGKSGNDLIRGASGDDILNGGLGNDTLRGQDGIDTADYSDLTFNGVFGDIAGLDVNLSQNSAKHSSNNNSLSWEDTLTTIENVIGTSRNDRFIGNQDDNVFDGKEEVNRSDRQTTFTDIDGDNYSVIADVVEYSGNQTDFTILGSSDNFTVSGSEIGTDTLIDIEFLKFDDGLITVDDSLFI